MDNRQFSLHNVLPDQSYQGDGTHNITKRSLDPFDVIPYFILFMFLFVLVAIFVMCCKAVSRRGSVRDGEGGRGNSNSRVGKVYYTPRPKMYHKPHYGHYGHHAGKNKSYYDGDDGIGYNPTTMPMGMGDIETGIPVYRDDDNGGFHHNSSHYGHHDSGGHHYGGHHDSGGHHYGGHHDSSNHHSSSHHDSGNHHSSSHHDSSTSYGGGCDSGGGGGGGYSGGGCDSGGGGGGCDSGGGGGCDSGGGGGF